MKAHLLYRNRDFDWQWALQAAAMREAVRTGRRYYHKREFDLQSGLPWNAGALTTDLELDTLLTAMAQGDCCVGEVARKAILTSSDNDLDTIIYRQQILQDCLSQPAVVRKLYAIAVEAMEKQKEHYLSSFFTKYPDSVLRWSIELLETLLGSIKKLRKLADLHADKFVSEGWTEFFAMVQRELSDEFIARVQYHSSRLRFRNGILISAKLSRGNKGAGYILHSPPDRKGMWLMRLARAWLPMLFARQPPVYGFSLNPRDESGAKALYGLRNRGIAIAANSLAPSADHVRNFFGALQTELAFYVGCLNLHEQLTSKQVPLCLPSPAPAEERRLSFHGLYDVCLTLIMDRCAVGNDANADGRDLVIVTGANQGGKSTFLRSVGLAQMMMQCGMFVPAEQFSSSVCDGFFTHYKREEDAGMKSGKFDEELVRMSDIVDHITHYPMILFNESFGATNEREGSEIARQIVSALLEKRVRMVFVSHLYEFAHGFYERNTGNILFLRADRRTDGSRTFKLVEGEPLRTSFGEDLYNSLFDN